jgi:toxin ParE1/3/4
LDESEGTAHDSVPAVSHRLEIRPQALADISEASKWYEERQAGLGERFTREVITAIEVLNSNPLIHRSRNRRMGARWCYPKNFPYRIVYNVVDDLITVVAVIHAARRDRAWKERFD